MGLVHDTAAEMMKRPTEIEQLLRAYTVKITKRVLALVKAEAAAPADPHLAAAERERVERHNTIILAMLRRGPCTNADMVRACGTMRASGRIHDLRKSGLKIKSVNLGRGLWRYELET